MHSFLRLLVVAAVATVVMAAAASSAFGTGISTSTASTVFTANPITVRDSSLGNWIWGITLTATLNVGTTLCTRAGLVQIGSVTSGAVAVTAPAGWSVRFRPFPLMIKCVASARGLFQPELTGGAPKIYWLSVSFVLNAGLLGTYTYAGSAVVALGASPATRVTGISSLLNSDRGTTFSFILPFSFSVSPNIVWGLVVLPDLA